MHALFYEIPDNLSLVARMEQALGADDRLTLRARRQRALLDLRLGQVEESLAQLLELSRAWE